MTVMFNEVWTETRVARLTELWANGFSCSHIAADLGCFAHCRDGGRSAVVGKIHRIKLPHPAGKMARSGSHTARTRAPRAAPATARPFLAPPAAPRLRNGHDPSQRRNPSHNIVAAIAIAGTEPGLPENLKGEEPDGTGMKFIDLQADSCRWPRGTPGNPDFEFCGGHALVDSPYCSRHSRIAYAAPQARVRQDKWALLGADLKS
jgi:GcrA cell cycle regulator